MSNLSNLFEKAPTQAIPEVTTLPPVHTRPEIAKAADVSAGTLHMAKAVLAQVDDKTNATMWLTNASSTKTRKMLDCGRSLTRWNS